MVAHERPEGGWAAVGNHAGSTSTVSALTEGLAAAEEAASCEAGCVPVVRHVQAGLVRTTRECRV